MDEQNNQFKLLNANIKDLNRRMALIAYHAKAFEASLAKAKNNKRVILSRKDSTTAKRLSDLMIHLFSRIEYHLEKIAEHLPDNTAVLQQEMIREIENSALNNHKPLYKTSFSTADEYEKQQTTNNSTV